VKVARGQTMGAKRAVFNTLIRTHHISSRKKLSRVRKAAENHGVAQVLFHYGKPGLMYAEAGSLSAVTGWIADVHALRYKDYHCAIKPAECVVNLDSAFAAHQPFQEVGSIAEFATHMESKALTHWWRQGMNYSPI